MAGPAALRQAQVHGLGGAERGDRLYGCLRTGPVLEPGDRRPGAPGRRTGRHRGPGDVAGGLLLHFNQVPEPKTIKNRIHLCLRPQTSREQEITRLLGLGATFLADHRQPDGAGWAVLTDLEGNEFCVLLSDPDRAGTSS